MARASIDAHELGARVAQSAGRQECEESIDAHGHDAHARLHVRHGMYYPTQNSENSVNSVLRNSGDAENSKNEESTADNERRRGGGQRSREVQVTLRRLEFWKPPLDVDRSATGVVDATANAKRTARQAASFWCEANVPAWDQGLATVWWR